MYQANSVKDFEAAYLDYFNNYLTVEKYAEHNEISIEEALATIRKGREINWQRHCNSDDEFPAQEHLKGKK